MEKSKTREKCIAATVSLLQKQIDQVSIHYGINRETVNNQSAIRSDWFHKDSALFDRTVSPDKLSEEREDDALPWKKCGRNRALLHTKSEFSVSFMDVLHWHGTFIKNEKVEKNKIK